MELKADITVIGAGAGGLMAAIWAGRAARDARRPLRIVAVDGARKLGAKILVAGGGRCNVTHDVVEESDYAGSSPAAIRKVLRRFDVSRTIEFFQQLGVSLKREETGKHFPTSDRASTVLDALIGAAREVNVELIYPARVERIMREGTGDAARFSIGGQFGVVRSTIVILATGGKSLPKTGSDGGGYQLARSLGHSLTECIFPALVPLVLDASSFVRSLSGLTLPATIELRSGTGKRLHTVTDSTLCTHFGISGPGVLDISRHYIRARMDDAGASLYINWLPGETAITLDAGLIEFARRHGPSGVARHFSNRLPQRLVKALCDAAGVDSALPAHSLSRESRRSLVEVVTNMRLPVVGDRGFAVAEATAGGVPLKELRLDTMESRACPGLYLCGEICDVDGRIGGYNFQWAWSSGYVAGISAASALLPPAEE